LSTWGEISHLILLVDLGRRFAQNGWRVVVSGMRTVREHVEREGFEFVPILPVAGPDGWELAAHLQRANNISCRRGGPMEGDDAALRSGRWVADITLERAVAHRQQFFLDLFEENGVDLLLWDPTELAAPAAARLRDLPHVGVNFLARPPFPSGDWWCEFMARWTRTVCRYTVASGVREAVGDVLDVVPRWPGQDDGTPDGLSVCAVGVRPDESMFEGAATPLGPSDGLILLSTAYRTGSTTITALIEGVRRAGLRPVVVAARSAGAPALEAADVVLDQARVGQLIGSCAVLVTAAGTHSVLTALTSGARTVAVPVRIHSYWEIQSAAHAGLPVCPSDVLTPDKLASLVSGASRTSAAQPTSGIELQTVAEALIDAMG
jgi:hypothetical protein